jgi:V/A-type H+/Na+-transporting ATPase subunit D
MPEVSPTRSAALALAAERQLMRQGYQFLDEKRMLVASEILRRLREVEALEATVRAGLRSARDALHAAVLRHGWTDLIAYPAAGAPPAAPRTRRALFLGVPILEADPVPTQAGGDRAALDASPEALACAAAFRALLEPLIHLAAGTGNLQRLAAEYRATERRARALENVLLPEVERAITQVQEQLELTDLEEVARTRLVGRR